jgi:predicted RND superfamily exporter protein
VARYADPCCELYLTGMPVLVETVNSYVANMWPRFALAFAIIAGILYASFGSWQGVVVPLMTGGLSAFWAMGLASWLDLTVDMFNNMSPVLVLAIGAGHSGQMLKRYYEERTRQPDNRSAVRVATVRMAPVMLAAGVTASAGFASLLLFRLPSLRAFGLVTAAGIACAVVLEMTFVPALRSLLPARELGATRRRPPSTLDRLLAALGRGVYRRPRPFAAAGALLVVLGFAAALRMPSSYSLPDYLPPSSTGRRHLEAVRAEFPGTVPLIVLLEGGPTFSREPATVAFVRGLEQALAADPSVVFTASYVDALREAHRALSGEDTDRLPESREGIAQVLYLAYSDQLARFISRDERRLAVWAFMNVYDTGVVSRVLAEAERYRAAHPLPGVDVRIAGGAAPLEVALNEETVRGKVLNVAVVLVVIFGVASLLLRSLLAGLCVLTPLLVTVALTFGALGALRVPLDLVSATIAAISVGIGADYAIYLLLRVIEERRERADVEQALVGALSTSGKAILFVAAAISAGYATLGVSEFPPFRLTALLVPMTMAVSCLAAMTVMLALVVMLRPTVAFRAPRDGELVP